MNYQEALKIVLEFVERYNKQDKEVNVAEASEVLNELVLECDHICSGNCRRNGCNCECGEWHNEQQDKFAEIKR
jgi:hypothetical protein